MKDLMVMIMTMMLKKQTIKNDIDKTIKEI